MAFRQRTSEQRNQQVARLQLSRWAAYEKHFNYFLHSGYSKMVVSFFNGLKQMTAQELSFLAVRYYQSTNYCRYDKELGDYRSVKPLTLKEVSVKLNRDVEELRHGYRELEVKLGGYL